jgi:hypothetical protein
MRAGKSAGGEHLGYLRSDPARGLGYVEPAIPQRHNAIGRGRIIATDVPPACVRRVRRVAIKLDGCSIRGVQRVAVLVVIAAAKPDLPLCRRQPVGPLHIALITPLEY